MKLVLRKARPEDAGLLGDICYRAFDTLAQAHGFVPDFPDANAAAGMMTGLIAHDGFFSVVAELGGRIVGSNFMDERGAICGIGPITVDPSMQNDGAGRALMRATLERAQERQAPGIRLVQAGYHNRSLALYLKLGFDAREQLACVKGPAIRKVVAGYPVRPATPQDVAACDELCLRVHGHARSGEVADAVAAGTARVVERLGRMSGYMTVPGFSGHAVAESNDDLMALLAAAESIQGAGVLVPTRNSDLLRWCLAQELKITQTMTLMTIGLYNAANGAWLPSILY
ncbi:MAG TPA: GNAT family N-acetyltransferase [Steroidobacteraceae bacterium]|nr:GNAT family N-acetyltransferase [Steroidobacteraceae bacterium]